MKNVWIISLLIISLASCSEETYYPSGLYGYQVEQLLTGGGKKHWFVQSQSIDGETQAANTCQDSVWRVFEMIKEDSISAYNLTFDASCTLYDTAFLGQMIASGGTDLFNDTIYLLQSNGRENYMLVDHISSKNLNLHYPSGNSVITERLDTSSTAILSRQVIPILMGGVNVGLSSWELITLYHDLVNKKLTNCEDTTQIFISKSELGTVLNLSVRDTTCESSETIVLGGIQEVGTDNEIYFNGTLFLNGGVVEEVKLSALNSSRFTIEYDSVKAIYRRW